MTVTEVRIRGLPKQKDFIRAEEREVLYSGAYRAGKSVALCLKAVSRATASVHAREALVRKHLITLKATTLRTLLEGDGVMPPILPHGTYTHNKADKIIRIRGCGEIVYFGLDDPDKIGSYTLSGCGVDEAVELSDTDYAALRGRVSLKVDGLPNQLYSACNPSAPSHHLAVRFGLGGGHLPQPGTRAIVTCMADNAANLPAEYIADAQTWTGLRKARYVDGLWAAAEGLVYDQWNTQVHVRERSGPWVREVVAVDEGYTNPFVRLRIGIDTDGRAHVLSEVYRPGMLVAEKVRTIREAATNAESVVIDPSAADVLAECRNAGLPTRPADNAVFDGIQRVQARLAVMGDGMPRLTVDPSCVNLIREVEGYQWRKSSQGTARDEPVKEADHAMDALRYAVSYIDAGYTLPFAVAVPGGRSVGDEVRTETPGERMARIFGDDL